MCSRKIVIVNAEKEPRDVLKNLLVEQSLEVLDFNNSMNAILWIKNHGVPAGLLIEEQATPLDAEKTIAYLKDELKTNCPVLVMVDHDKHCEYAQGIIKTPFTETTGLDIRNTLCIAGQKLENSPKPEHYSLTYLEEIYEGNKDLILESLQIFKTSVRDKLGEIEDLIAHQNYEEVRNVAHNIKPSFEMINSKKGKELCRKLVYESEDQELHDRVKALVAEYVKIKEELNTYIPTSS